MTPDSILCCGEALIDMLPGPDGSFLPHPGGAVFNTAVALGRLGARAGFFWGLSRDMFGAMLDARLTEAGVDTTACLRTDRPCTLAFVALVEGQARYAFYDEGTAGRMLTTADLPDRLPRALFLGGISLVAEPCGTTMETLFARAIRDRVVMIDPNIRPGFIRDPASFRARMARMLPAADIVKLSVEDLAWLSPDGALVPELLRAGVKLVCVTDGAAGVRAWLPGAALHEPARAVPVADTVGAGDTFNAGLLASLQSAGALTKAGLAALTPDTVQAALRLGVAAAAITVSRPGANPPWAQELCPAGAA